MARLSTDRDVKNNSPKKFKKILSDVTNFIIYDKSGDYAVTMSENQIEKDEFKEIFVDNERDFEPIVEFTKSSVNVNGNDDIIESETSSGYENNRKKYNVVKKRYSRQQKNNADVNSGNSKSSNFAEIFDSVKQEKKESAGNKSKNKKDRINYSFGYESTKTSIPSISAETTDQNNDNDNDPEPENSVKPTRAEMIEKLFGKINISNTVKRILILAFSILCGSVSLPFAQVSLVINPLGISLLSAADKYIFYIYSGLVISLAFYNQNAVIFLCLYTVIAGVKFYLKYTKEKSKVEMLSESVSYNNLNKKEKVRLLNLIHLNDTGSVVISILVCAISCCLIGFLSIAMKTGGMIYTDIASVMLFTLVSMLFAYLFSGLFDVGKDNQTLGKTGICAVIFTVVYFLAPFYAYTLSLGYIVSFVLTLIAANSGIKKSEKTTSKTNKKEHSYDVDSEVSDTDEVNPNEEIISRFAVKLIHNDGVLSDMTRGALVGLLCGVALGDTAGAVTLGICGLVSGLFFSQSTALAIIAGIISAASYSVYVAGMDAVQRYIPNMLAGLTFYVPAAMLYASVTAKIQSAGQYDKKSSPLMDKGLLIAELPANKLNNLSDAFHGLSGIFHEISEKFKTPNANEIKTIVSACIDRTCEKCVNYESCSLSEKPVMAAMQKKCVEFIVKNGRLNPVGIPQIFMDECVKISDIQSKINAVYCSKTEENIENNKTKIFADNYENIAKLLQNNIKSGKEDIAFKRDMSEKIFLCLESMGIECENVIVMGERKKTVYIFGIKMVSYSGTIADITEMLERICGTCFDHPEYIMRDNYIIMKNQSRNKFKIYSMQMTKSAGELREKLAANSENSIDNSVLDISSESLEIQENVEEVADFETGDKAAAVNGDSVSVFNGGEGFMYGLISDGMGSGKNAALSSRLTVLLTEKLLSAGNQKDLTIEMINSMLISKSDECFASVDLFEADLITGKASFIKAGAAPSFVVRNGKLFKIQSSTVPAGIIESINSEQTKFDMESGDYILMLSDGIISTFEEGAWLLEIIGAEQNLRDPKNLLNQILREAARKNSRKDDMSVLFMKVAEERKTAEI